MHTYNYTDLKQIYTSGDTDKSNSSEELSGHY